MSWLRKARDRVVDIYFGIPKDKKGNNMTYIREILGGQFVLVNSGAPIGKYSRRRDAVRGAKRRGLTLA